MKKEIFPFIQNYVLIKMIMYLFIRDTLIIYHTCSKNAIVLRESFQEFYLDIHFSKRQIYRSSLKVGMTNECFVDFWLIHLQAELANAFQLKLK
ncbi:hypothetical protein, partial [Metabacillus fastidiosus]|uniref:hypothetical protein n=1 Tax=Metabacillus fastidiosus TaxID=1458 RepID=UPI002DBE049B